MTFVAAKRFGERVVIVSDTMLTDPNQTAPDIIPGSLKSVIIDPQTTIAFAGLRNQSIDAIDIARHSLNNGKTLIDVEHALHDTVMKYHGEIEFLIASHRDKISLKRIWTGGISENLDFVCLGERALASRLLALEDCVPLPAAPNEFEDEFRFSSAFRQLFDGLRISDGAGGFCIVTTCSPFGHFYNSAVGVASWDVVQGGVGLTAEQLVARKSGTTQWGYNTNGSRVRGVGAVGAIVTDAGIGFIYAPALQDQPISWRFDAPDNEAGKAPILEAFQAEIDRVADLIGGGIEANIPDLEPWSPTQSALEEIIAYARSCAIPTTVELHDDSLWIRCGTNEAYEGTRVAFNILGLDAVRILKITIDRLNDRISSRLKSRSA